MTIKDVANRLNELANERRYFFMCQLAKETAPLWNDANMTMLNDIARMAAIIATENLKEELQ